MALDMRVLHGESCALAPWPLGRKCTCCDTNILKKTAVVCDGLVTVFSRR